MLFTFVFVLTDVRDGKGQSLLDRAFENVYYAEGCIDVTLYLTAYGCGSEEHKAKLLCEVSRRGRLDMAKELVEQHNVVPNGKHFYFPYWLNQYCVQVTVFNDSCFHL